MLVGQHIRHAAHPRVCRDQRFPHLVQRSLAAVITSSKWRLLKPTYLYAGTIMRGEQIERDVSRQAGSFGEFLYLLHLCKPVDAFQQTIGGERVRHVHGGRENTVVDLDQRREFVAHETRKCRASRLQNCTSCEYREKGIRPAYALSRSAHPASTCTSYTPCSAVLLTSTLTTCFSSPSR